MNLGMEVNALIDGYQFYLAEIMDTEEAEEVEDSEIQNETGADPAGGRRGAQFVRKYLAAKQPADNSPSWEGGGGGRKRLLLGRKRGH